VFFTMLDAVAPDGVEFLSGDFEAELQRLYAQPDPTVSERCGVQLMTIHKAKGLGFDVVIVPGLERGSGKDRQSLICSLERISPHSGKDEFLVAPIGLRGEETHPLYQWVQKQRRIRFDEERRRLFYVACTRARRELHLLGTAEATKSGLKSGANESLLNAAWPGLEREFSDAWMQQGKAADNVLPFPSPATGPITLAAAEQVHPLTLRRLPSGADLRPRGKNVLAVDAKSVGLSDEPPYRRPEGSRVARLTGETVHTLLQRLGPQLTSDKLDVDVIRSHTVALLRAAALSGEPLRIATETVMKMLLACAADPECRWILSPHPEAQSEASWTGMAGGTLRTLRADRIFRAGAEPKQDGTEYLWVIDYKTSTEQPEDRDTFLQKERRIYAPQLQAYGRAMRMVYGKESPLRLGLYYPQITVLDWWNPEEGL
jgi:ATP-dependent exoDNAse (exonuclease V) beta subunit